MEAPRKEQECSDNKAASSEAVYHTTKESERTARTRIKNRRKLYLDRHPSYFESPDLELADPLLYDRCIRQFQTAAEREVDVRAKGYSGVLEADLYRSEAKLAALAQHNYGTTSKDEMGSSLEYVSYIKGPDGQILQENPDEIPKDKEEGINRWKEEMTIRFLAGKDTDFSYKEVDENDDLDVIERREAQDSWFEEEEPQWVGSEGGEQGETGIQDF